MIQILTILNPITFIEENWNINIDNLDYNQWQQYVVEIIGNSNEMAFNYYLDCLNPQIYKDKLYFDTTSFAYKEIIIKYFRRLYTLINYIEYNYWLDKLINKIQDNLIFEYEFKITSKVMKEHPKIDKPKKESKPNKWVKLETEDLFDGHKTYIYENLKTGEQIESDDPNKLEELNAPKKKEKVQKVVSFSFKFNK